MISQLLASAESCFITSSTYYFLAPEMLQEELSHRLSHIPYDFT